jgi:hypothetical protein
MHTPDPGPALRITRIDLENIRGFRKLDLPLAGTAGERRRTVIIGKNGTCKSTLLRAIAVGLSDLSDAGALIAEPTGGLVGNREDFAKITLEVTSPVESGQINKLLRRIDKDKESLQADPLDSRPAQQVFVCGYGAGRSHVGPDPSGSRGHRTADSVRTLFDYRQPLIDPELTLRRLQDFLGTDRYERTLLGIKRALGLSDDDAIVLGHGGGVELVGPTVGGVGGKARLEGWADGYRVTFSWLLDLYARAMRADRIGADGSIDGIVLIDEVEQHLHPSMQQTILPHLVKLLPTTQLILTTHSPLVALAADPTELVVLKRRDDEILVEPQVPDFSSYSAEDMLVDERLFDSEARAPEMVEKLGRYRELAAKSPTTRSAGEAVELRSLGRAFTKKELPKSRQTTVLKELQRVLDKHDL